MKDAIHALSERRGLKGKAATQERILLAATKLFMSQGYERTTIIEVAELASVSRATVFWHFSDKAGLFRETFARLLAPFRASLERNLDDVEPEKRLGEQLAIYDDFVTNHRTDLEGFVRWAVESPDFRQSVVTSLLDMHQRFVGALTQTLAEIVPAGTDPKALATGLMLMMDANFILSIFDSRLVEERRASVDAFVALLPRKARS
jgi:AcrR family transcriptional regulator